MLRGAVPSGIVRESSYQYATLYRESIRGRKLRSHILTLDAQNPLAQAMNYDMKKFYKDKLDAKNWQGQTY